MRWIYLSPHLDDIVLSCGGMVWQQVQAGDVVEIWTIFSGDAPPGPLAGFAQELHTRWQTGPEASAVRRAEDVAACQQLGAAYRHWLYPDCIYRRLPDGTPLIHRNEDLSMPIHVQEAALVEELAERLAAALPARCRVVSPLSIGGHVDHRITRAAAEKIGGRLYYYPDYPYLVNRGVNLSHWIEKGWRSHRQEISPAGLAGWQAAVACHVSQISTFWGGLEEMRRDIGAYWQGGGGSRLWWKPETHD